MLGISISCNSGGIISAKSGAPFASSEQMDNEFKFSGQFGVQHIDDALVYMRNRFYSPSIGRFISEDPLGLLSINMLVANPI